MPDHAPSLRFYDHALARFSRRELLNAAWKLGLAAVTPSVVTRTLSAQMAFSEYPFTLGVASGDPLPTGVVLWTRLAPKPLEGGGMPMASIEVGWEVADDRAFRTVVQKGTTIARPELGHSVHVEVEGLRPGRDYFYRFRVGREVSPVGRTKTAPAVGAPVDRLRFAVCGCSHYEQGYFTAYRHLADEAVDFVFHTGDYIYETRTRPDVVRPHNGQEIYTLVDYRNRYALYQMDPDLRAAQLSAPFIVSWDDHEVDNDYADDHDEQDTPPEVFVLRRAAAYQAYYESMPLRASQMPRGPDMRLYRRLTFGNLVDFNVLDTRQYRSDQVCQVPGTNDCHLIGDPSRSIIGSAQEQWLFGNLADARARWTVLGQQVPTFARDFDGTTSPVRWQTDKWDGYTASRARVFSRLQETKAPNPIVLSGDVHLHYGADLKVDFTRPESPTIGAEFTNTSISSGGDGTAQIAMWEALRANNPHLKYHGARRGYISCTATPETMRADFRVVDRVTVRDRPVTTDGSLVVEAGRPGAVKA